MQMLKQCWQTIKSSWMTFAHWFGEVNQSILLGLLYFIGIGIYACILKPILWLQPRPKTMWREFKDNQNSLKDLEKSF